MKFEEFYNVLEKNDLLIEESLLSTLTNPRSLIALALLIGITHVNYTIPKLKEIVHHKIRTLPPKQVEKIMQKVPEKAKTPIVDALMKELTTIRYPAQKPQPQPTEEKPTQVSEQPVDDFITSAMEYIKKHEGVKNKIYKDIYGNPTIGIGHLIKPEEMSKFEGKTLTPEEIQEIFETDVNNKLELIRSHFGSDFDKFSKNMKIAILDGYFRGDLSGSPKTRLLLKSRKFPEAAKEYLANREYEAAKAAKSGVAKRMENNAKIFASES